MHLFADDTKLLFKQIKESPDNQLVQADLYPIDNWCEKRNLSLNLIKRVHLFFPLRRYNPILVLW